MESLREKNTDKKLTITSDVHNEYSAAEGHSYSTLRCRDAFGPELRLWCT